MDKNNNNYSSFNGYYGYPPFTPFDNFDPNMVDNNFDPMAQYEQGYIYYRYLTQAVEYKIRCKELEKMNSKDLNTDRRMN